MNAHRINNHLARFIPSEEIDAQRVQHWNFGDVHDGGMGGFAVMPEMLPPARTAEQAAAEAPVPAAPVQPAEPSYPESEVQHMLEQARQEGFQQGLERGLQQGVQQGLQQATQEAERRMAEYQQGQGREIAEQLHSVLLAAQAGVQGLQQQMAPDLLQLACDIARQVVRQELRTNPHALQPVVAEALDMLQAETKPALVRLNPEDFAQLEAHLRAALPNPKVEWLADPSVQRGDCRVESQGALVDGSLERRWQRAVAALGLVSTWYEGGEHGA